MLNFSNDFTGPVGTRVETATSEIVMVPDYGLNMEICDLINDRPDGPENAVRALRKRFKSDNKVILSLSITLADMCVKNCNARLHQAFCSKDFLGDLSLVATNTKLDWSVQEAALGLIQQWGQAFEQRQDRYPLYWDTYNKLRVRGLDFPQAPNETPVFTPPASQVHSTQTSQHPIQANQHPIQTSQHPDPVYSSPIPQTTNTTEFDKLSQDIDLVLDRVGVCKQLLSTGSTTSTNEVLYESIGFLEACLDRLQLVVEAGAQGLLSEALFAKSLRAYDAVQKMLDAEKNGVIVEKDDSMPAMRQMEPGETKAAGDKGQTSIFFQPALTATKPTPDQNTADLFDIFNNKPSQPTIQPVAAEASSSSFDPFGISSQQQAK